jgi:hypothetical protein
MKRDGDLPDVLPEDVPPERVALDATPHLTKKQLGPKNGKDVPRVSEN